MAGSECISRVALTERDGAGHAKQVDVGRPLQDVRGTAPSRPLTSISIGPAAVNLISVWSIPVRIWRAPIAALVNATSSCRRASPTGTGVKFPVSRNGSASGKRPVSARWLT